MRALVTGGTGYVGRFLVEGLLDDGHDVTVFGRSTPAPGMFRRPVAFQQGGLEPDSFPIEMLQGFDLVVHAAFHHIAGKYRGGEGGDPAGFVRRNLDASVALFAAAKAAGVGKVAFLSSRAVYGPKPSGATLTEDMQLSPDTLYGEVKRDAEEALLASSDAHFRPVVLRVTGVYGHGQPHKWAGLFDDYLAGRQIATRAGTEVHGADVSAALGIALAAEKASVFNVSDRVVDRHDLLAIVKDATGTPHPLPARADTAGINVMDCRRLQALGWKPGGEELLRRTVRQLLG